MYSGLGRGDVIKKGLIALPVRTYFDIEKVHSCHVDPMLISRVLILGWFLYGRVQGSGAVNARVNGDGGNSKHFEAEKKT